MAENFDEEIAKQFNGLWGPFCLQQSPAGAQAQVFVTHAVPFCVLIACFLGCLKSGVRLANKRKASQ